MKSAIIMAAGKGTRMMSDLPKGLHKVCNKPMVEHLIEEAKASGANKVVTIVGYGSELVKKAMEGKCEFALQEPQLGTGHAVMQATSCRDDVGKTLVINGDCPCLSRETFSTLYDELDGCEMVVLTAIVDDAKSYGRVVRKSDGTIEKIVEFKDCNEEEVKIKEINTGIYSFDNQTLFNSLSEISNNNAQAEYYITDLVEILNRKNLKVKAVVAKDIDEVAGVNDRLELAQANKTMQKRINEEWMRKGVTMIDPLTTYIGKDVQIARDVILYPNIHLEGKTVIGTGTTILPSSFLQDAIIGERCTVDSSKIVQSEMKDHCTIGPNSHLRMNTVVGSDCRIGNYVELKNTHFGHLSRCAHLTYLGDCEVGEDVNIGCGVVTVNYDGKHKFKTTIGDGAFVGSNVNLIAPIHVGKNAVIAAGTTANQNVADGDLAIGRTRQENKCGYGVKYKNKE